jgi:hypothetical protein
MPEHSLSQSDMSLLDRLYPCPGVALPRTASKRQLRCCVRATDVNSLQLSRRREWEAVLVFAQRDGAVLYL